MARDFNGSSDYIDFGDATALDPTLSMTVVAWIDTDSTSGEAGIMSRGRAGGPGGGFGFNFQRVNGDELRISKHGVVDIDSTSINLSANTRTLVAAVISSTQVRFHKYVPGVGLTSQNISNNQSFNAGSSSSRIGCIQNNTGTNLNFWDGEICEPAVFKRQLSDAEITSIGLGYSPLFFPASLVFYSKLVGDSTEKDYMRGASGALTGTTKTAHFRIIYPNSGFGRRFTTQSTPPASTFFPSRRMMRGIGI